MRISDIHFREVNADDITYLMSNDADYKPQVYRDYTSTSGGEGEQYELDLGEWRESLKRLC